MHQELSIAFFLAALIFAVKATKYCDEYTSKCHPCMSEVRCFCRHYNKQVSLSCLNLAGSGRNYLQLLNYEGEPICPTDYIFMKMMKKQTEIDETYEYKHTCQCTEGINDVATACNTNGVHERIAQIAKTTAEMEVKSEVINLHSSELTTEPVDSVPSSQTGANCHYPITWFLGSHCGDRKSVATLVWVLLAILMGQSFVILSMLIYIIFGFRMHEPKIVCFEQADNQGFSPPSLNKTLNDNNCERDVENIYSEPVNSNENIDGYLTMRSPLKCQYEEPINFKPCYTNNNLAGNTSVASNPIVS